MCKPVRIWCCPHPGIQNSSSYGENTRINQEIPDTNFLNWRTCGFGTLYLPLSLSHASHLLWQTRVLSDSISRAISNERFRGRRRHYKCRGRSQTSKFAAYGKVVGDVGIGWASSFAIAVVAHLWRLICVSASY